MIEALLHRLHENATLDTLLVVTPDDSRIHPGSIAYPGPGIGYEFTDLIADTPRQSQVTFRVSSLSHDLTAAIVREVEASLHIGDAESGWWYSDTNILACKLNGGGSLEMEDVGMFQRFVTFDVKWRDK